MKGYSDQNRLCQTVEIITLLRKIIFVFLDAFACHGKFYFLHHDILCVGGSIFILTSGTVSLYLQMETRKRLAKIVLVFVGCFVFCWFPNHILYMYRSFNYNEIDPSLGHMIVTLVARVLSFCNSCVNPFALYLLSESFRRHFNSQLCCGRKSYQEGSTSYLPSSSAVRMTSLKSNAKNMMTNSVLLNGHSLKQEMALWFELFNSLCELNLLTFLSPLSRAERNNFLILTIAQLIHEVISWLTQKRQDKHS